MCMIVFLMSTFRPGGLGDGGLEVVQVSGGLEVEQITGGLVGGGS